MLQNCDSSSFIDPWVHLSSDNWGKYKNILKCAVSTLLSLLVMGCKIVWTVFCLFLGGGGSVSQSTPPWNIFDVGKLLLTCLKGPWCKRTYTRVCLSGQRRIRSVHKKEQQTRGDKDDGVVIWNQPFHLANLVSMWVSLLRQIMTKNETGTFLGLNPTQTKGAFRRWCSILLISLKLLLIKILFPWLSQNDLLSLLVRNLQIQVSLRS